MSILGYLKQNSRVLNFVDQSIYESLNENVWTFLIGKNGSGKSNLLRGIVIDSLKKSKFKKVIAISNTQHHKFPFEIDLYNNKELDVKKYHFLAFQNDLYFYSFSKDKINELNYEESGLYDRYNLLDPYSFKTFLAQEHILLKSHYNIKPSFNNYLYIDNIVLNIKNIKNIYYKILEVLNFINLDEYIEIKTEINLYEESLERLKNALSREYYYHKNNDYREKINAILSNLENVHKIQKFSLLDLSEELILTISILLRLKLIRIREINFQREKNLINSTNLSSGEKSVLSIMFSLISNLEENSIICIDEPEINLHPEWQEKIIKLIELTSTNYCDCHFFIATHSPQLLSGIKTNNSFILDLSTNELKKSLLIKNKSTDFQLSEVFNFPGNNNEYLIRKLIVILNKINNEDDSYLDNENINLLNHLKKLIEEKKIDKDDKVSILFDLIKSYGV